MPIGNQQTCWKYPYNELQPVAVSHPANLDLQALQVLTYQYSLINMSTVLPAWSPGIVTDDYGPPQKQPFLDQLVLIETHNAQCHEKHFGKKTYYYLMMGLPFQPINIFSSNKI